MRAIAVGLVFLHHLAVLPGGGVGVTVFFVLSGFLITSLLLRERESTGKVRLKAFYLRRGRRLLPALAVVMAAVFAGMALVGDAGGIGPLFVITALYLGNYAEAGGANLGALGHTWSLAIEEQFYLVWPLLMLGLVRFPRRWILGGLLVIAGSIMAARMWTALTGPLDAAMYPTQLRADALLLGCALALVPLSPPRWVVGIGVVGLLASLALPAPLGVGVAAIATVPLIARRIPALEWKPVVYVGMISYGVYLWHFPVIYALRPYGLLWLAIPLTLVLASLSYHLWEKRFLRRSHPARRPSLRRPARAPTVSAS
jgi:peptidoglycan/LPS O-acetylase OafA/YrhL